jgi:hypothetical protein
MPVDGNCKHLGVTFSSDGKWTNHINDIIESSMKQINALRKPKYIPSSKNLSNIYLILLELYSNMHVMFGMVVVKEK